MFRIAQQGSQGLQIVHFVGHAYQPHLPIAFSMLSAHQRKTCQVLVGKGRQQMHVTDTGIQVSDTYAQTHRVCALESSSCCKPSSIIAKTIKEVSVRRLLLTNTYYRSRPCRLSTTPKFELHMLR